MTTSRNEITLEFFGPFSFDKRENSIFHSEFADSTGIYLWTIKQIEDDSHLIHYIGETKCFAKRYREHLTHMLGMNYGIASPKLTQQGCGDFIWPGMWRDKTADGPLNTLKFYAENSAKVSEYIGILTVFFAPFDGQEKLRKHIEGCIARNLREHHPDSKALYPDDNWTVKYKRGFDSVVNIQCSEKIRGLDMSMLI